MEWPLIEFRWPKIKTIIYEGESALVKRLKLNKEREGEQNEEVSLGL